MKELKTTHEDNEWVKDNTWRQWNRGRQRIKTKKELKTTHEDNERVEDNA